VRLLLGLSEVPFHNHGDEYFTFLDRPGIEPTNNGPERQIRFLAIDRKITQGTRRLLHRPTIPLPSAATSVTGCSLTFSDFLF